MLIFFIWFSFLGTPGTTNAYLHGGIKNTGSILFTQWGNDLNNYEYHVINSWKYYCFTFITITRARAIYINGTVVATDIVPAQYTGTGPLDIGVVTYSGIQMNLFGRLDEFKIYLRTLSTGNVVQLYMNQYCDRTLLAIHYRFDTTKSNDSVLYDWSGNERHAVLIGIAPSWTRFNGQPRGTTMLQYACACRPEWSGSNCTISTAGCTCANGGNCTSCATIDGSDGDALFSGTSYYLYSNDGTNGNPFYLTQKSFSGKLH